MRRRSPNSKKAREVAIPRSVAEVLARRIEGRSTDDLVFTTPAGTPLRNLNWRDVHWNQVCKELGLAGVTRTTCAGPSATSPVRPAPICFTSNKALGNSSITVTAAIYAHLFDTELDQVSDALDRITDAASGPNTVQAPKSRPGIGAVTDRRTPSDLRKRVEPPIGIEPMTYSSRGSCRVNLAL